MKKLFLLVAAMCVCLGATAQEALRSGSQIVSPEIHDNNSVTLRLFAPEAKKVMVAGFEYCLLRSLFGRHLPGTSPN